MTTNSATMTTQSAATAPQQMSSSSSSSSMVEQTTLWLSILVFVMNSIFLIYFHCRTTTTTNRNYDNASIISSLMLFGDRTTIMSTIPLTDHHTYNDPGSYDNDTISVSSSNHTDQFHYNYFYYYYPNIDMILFTSLIVMAFEILDYITRNSGSTYIANIQHIYILHIFYKKSFHPIALSYSSLFGLTKNIYIYLQHL
jgi:hypothetical protein